MSGGLDNAKLIRHSMGQRKEAEMEHRSPIMVFFVSLITFGIYGLVWYVKTKNEMNAKGAQIPTAWLLIFR